MANAAIILAVDQNLRNLELMKTFLQQHGYCIETANTLEQVDQLLNNRPIALALIDIPGFDRGIWERCERLRDARIPFLVICSPQQTGIEADSYRHGAQNTLTKPLLQRQLLGMIKGLLSKEAE